VLRSPVNEALAIVKIFMDHIELRTPTEKYIYWPDGGGFQQVEICINGTPLIEIIREIELPYARMEYDDRVAKEELAENLNERDSLAGDYHYLSRDLTFSPSQNFFGKSYEHGFIVPENDLTKSKSLILGCTCGILECWFLLADIRIKEKTVEWANFQQFHREWNYELDPFVFDRLRYEKVFGEKI